MFGVTKDIVVAKEIRTRHTLFTYLIHHTPILRFSAIHWWTALEIGIPTKNTIISRFDCRRLRCLLDRILIAYVVFRIYTSYHRDGILIYELRLYNIWTIENYYLYTDKKRYTNWYNAGTSGIVITTTRVHAVRVWLGVARLFQFRNPWRGEGSVGKGKSNKTRHIICTNIYIGTFYTQCSLYHSLSVNLSISW